MAKMQSLVIAVYVAISNSIHHRQSQVESYSKSIEEPISFRSTRKETIGLRIVDVHFEENRLGVVNRNGVPTWLFRN